MKRSKLEVGKITSTHGIRGEVRAECWCDSPAVLCKIKQLYTGGEVLHVQSARVQGTMVLLKFVGIDSIDDAEKLKGIVLEAARDDIKLSPGSYFISDCENAVAVNADNGDIIGNVKEILFYPGRYILSIDAGRELLIPMVSEFIKEVDPDNGIVRVHLIDGM